MKIFSFSCQKFFCLVPIKMDSTYLNFNFFRLMRWPSVFFVDFDQVEVTVSQNLDGLRAIESNFNSILLFVSCF